MKLAASFANATKLAKRVRDLQDIDIEQYREILRAGIAFQRRRRSLHRSLADIPETDSDTDSD